VNHPKPSAKNESGEYATFEAALKKVLSVRHSKMKSKLDAEKRRRIRASASHASTANDLNTLLLMSLASASLMPNLLAR
jgi:hypothetical protein